MVQLYLVHLERASVLTSNARRERLAQRRAQRKRRREMLQRAASSGLDGLGARALATLAHIVRTDQNVICVGLAMDALHRLGARYALAKEACGRLLDGSRAVLPADALSRTPSE